MPQEGFTKYRERGAYHWASCDRRSSTYDPPTEARYEAILQRVTKGGALADVGCGDGYLLHAVESHFDLALGIDDARSAVTTAARALGRETRSRLCLGHCEHLPLARASLDIVVLADVIEHLSNPQVSLTEVRRALSPTGRLVLTTPMWRADRMWDPDHHVKEYRPGELRALLESHFRRVELFFFLSRRWWQVRRRLGKVFIRVFSRYVYNPFIREGRDPDRFWHMLAVCDEPRTDIPEASDDSAVRSPLGMSKGSNETGNSAGTGSGVAD